VNPYGLHIWEVPFKLAQMPEVRASIAEWQRPDMGHWLYPPHIGVWVLLLALVLAPRSVTLPDLMVVLFFGGLSLTANRHLAIGMLVAAPILARQLTALWTMAASRLTRLSAWERPAATAALTTAISALLVWLSLGLTLERAGIGMERSRYPIGAAKFLNGHRLAGNLFNSYTYGNYLLFACYPQNRVFIDGRVDMYGGGVVGLYDIVRRAAPGWADCLRKYAVDICVLGASATEGRLMDGLHASPEWALVYWDDISAVYLRRVPRYQAFLQSARIYTVRADQFDEAALSAADRRRQAEEEYRAKLNEDPDCAMALYGLARCLGARGAREEALGPLRRAIVVQPQNGTLHYALGTFLMELGRLDEAEAAYHQALRLCPGQSEPYLAMSVIAHRRGRLDEAIADCRNALKYSPKNWKISWNLSVLYEEKGDIANALAAARNVVALNPEMKAAVEKVNALQSKLKNAESPQP
jgi:tetratricopeptide (TPR) repeat protein